jgi:hypothetical protein
LLVGGIGMLVLLAVVLVLVLHNNSGARAAAPPAVVTAGIDLAPPQDLTDRVVLNWTSQRPLTFFVVVEEDGRPKRYPSAGQSHTMTLPVDPAAKYCFLIRGSDVNGIYQSRPAAVRGATCHE